MYHVEKPYTEYVSKVAEGEVKPEEPTQEVSGSGGPAHRHAAAHAGCSQEAVHGACTMAQFLSA